jgi:hypothetical protein
MLLTGFCGVVEIDIFGQTVSVTAGVAARLRELAAAEAGRSNSARDLSLVLDRALRTGAKVSLQRGEARALSKLLRTPADEELASLAQTIQAAAARRLR